MQHKRLAIGGVGDGQMVEDKRQDGGPVVIAPEFNLMMPLDGPLVTSRYRREALRLGHYVIDVWVDEEVNDGEALLKLVEGYRPEPQRVR